MHAAVIGERNETAGGRPARCWQEVVELAQMEFAVTLEGAMRDGRMNRTTYQYWLATESAICRINALALDALADWHVSSPPLRATAHVWATAMRVDALAAAADVRGIDGMAAAMPSQIGPWQAFLESASRSSRAGEALGAVVLHARLMRGPARTAIAAVTELPFVPVRGSRYLLQRAQAQIGDAACDPLLHAYARSALASGAQRAAAWYRAAVQTVLSPPA